MGKFSFSKDDVLSTANVIKTESEKMIAKVNEITAEAEHIKDSWEEESTNAFIEKLNSIVAEVKNRINELNQLAEILEKAAIIVEQTEQANAGQVGA